MPPWGFLLKVIDFSVGSLSIYVLMCWCRRRVGGCSVLIVDDMQNPADKHVCSRLQIHPLQCTLSYKQTVNFAAIDCRAVHLFALHLITCPVC